MRSVKWEKDFAFVTAAKKCSTRLRSSSKILKQKFEIGLSALTSIMQAFFVFKSIFQVYGLCILEPQSLYCHVLIFVWSFNNLCMVMYKVKNFQKLTLTLITQSFSALKSIFQMPTFVWSCTKSSTWQWKCGNPALLLPFRKNHWNLDIAKKFRNQFFFQIMNFLDKSMLSPIHNLNENTVKLGYNELGC